MTTEPVFAAGFAIVFGGEPLTWRLLLGGTLVLSAMFLVETKEPVAAQSSNDLGLGATFR